jgi:2-phosphosulfolactate phosphatase
VRLDVAFLPRDLAEPETCVCIVIDALRATSTLATVFGRGVEAVAVAETIEDARLLHRDMPGSLLCGEEGGLPPAGFDHGNSPTEFEHLDLAGRRLVLATSNGTRALAALDTARVVFAGSLVNLSACVRAALTATAGIGTLAVVCSGTELGRAFSLEDTVVAGAFIDCILREAPEAFTDVTDRATAAQRLWQRYADEPRAAFEEARHGRHLITIGMAEDLDACARIDRYGVAPRLQVTVDGRLLLRAEPTPQRTPHSPIR